MQHEKSRELYNQAVIMRAAVNSAIAVSFGKDRGSFDRFLASILPARERSKHIATSEQDFARFKIKVPENAGTMDDWQEIE